jgi:hypothetical protein
MQTQWRTTIVSPVMIPRSLAVLLALFGAVLTVTVIPGVFTVDEPNYMVSVGALRSGHFSLPGTEDLPASEELAYFDVGGFAAQVPRPGVRSVVPPLYAYLALPFAYLDWRGLVLLNTLAFLAILWAVFHYTRDVTRSRAAPWVAVTAAGLGSYAIEYAQGLWPHMLSAALCASGIFAALRAAAGRRPRLAAASGLLIGAAVGIRYQNIALAAVVAATLPLRRKGAARNLAAYAVGLALPLLVCSVTNFYRIGSWNPISKGARYLRVEGTAALESPASATVRAFATRVVDFRWHPRREWADGTVPFVLHPHPESGAFVLLGAVKKAWLQSAPWAALALVVPAAAWSGWRGRPATGRDPLRALGLIVWSTLGFFSAVGLARTDGFCFNQRYFLELVPLAAVALAIVLDAHPLQRGALLAGAALATLAAAGTLRLDPSDPLRHDLISLLPLLLAVLLLGGWRLAEQRQSRHLLSAGLAACIAWAFAVHVGDDLPASRTLRQRAAAEMTALAPHLPAGAAVFTWGAHRNAVAPLQLDRDLVILDALRDRGRDAPRLVRALLARQRRVFVVTAGFPPDVLGAMGDGLAIRFVLREPVPLVELSPLGFATEH